MISRRYTKQVTFYQTAQVADGYGGFTVSETLVATSWADIKSGNSKRLVDLGITDVANAIVLKLRYRNDIEYTAANMYVKYRGVKYIIQSAVMNIDFKDTEVELIAMRDV